MAQMPADFLTKRMPTNLNPRKSADFSAMISGMEKTKKVFLCVYLVLSFFKTT